MELRPLIRGPLARLPVILSTVILLGACAFASRTLGGRNHEAIDLALGAYLDSLAEPALDSIYGRPARALWVDGGGLTSGGRSALETLEASRADGIDPSRYGLDEIREAADQDGAATERARLDVRVTRSLALLSQDLAAGVVASTGFDPGWDVDSLDAPELPARSGGLDAIVAHLDAVRPSVEQYARLQDLLVQLEELRDDGGWPEVDRIDGALQEGDSSAAVAQVRERLRRSLNAQERELAGRNRRDATVYDADLAAAVSAFQGRHDVEQDGVLGPETVDAMNRPVEERIADVALALERWRWLPADLGSLAVVVNTAGRRVHVMRDGRPEMTMKAIVGQQDWKTTLFQDEMEQIVVNPYWNVPENIMVEETLPAAREDDQYLPRNGFEVVDPSTDEIVPLDDVDWDDVDAEDFEYRIRQRPGPTNALGSVKFLFPNSYAIYFHDTPADDKFDERLRTFSHGCVRVERPAELARFLLREASSHDPDSFEALRETGEQHVLDLDRHVPVFIIYQTVWVDDGGVPIFAPDIYDRDDDAMRALASELGIFAGDAIAQGP